MTDTDTPTTFETILASAAGETDPMALSAAAETSGPDVDAEPATFEGASGALASAAEHETRIQRLEDEIAFLRKMFGWPEKGE